MRVIQLVEALAIGDDRRGNRRRFEVANEERAATGEPGVEEFATLRPIADFLERTILGVTADGRTP